MAAPWGRWLPARAEGMVESMFAKLRRRLSHVPDGPLPPRPPAASPEPATAPRPAVPIDDAAISRIVRIRTALEDAGAAMPAASAPASSAVTADDEWMEEMTAYLGGVPARYAFTEEGCSEIINQIEMLVVLKEMDAAGVRIRCTRGERLTSAAQLRAAFEQLRNQEKVTASDSPLAS
ncbi:MULTISPECIES: hypothetical protein [Streptomyces]|nr:hypothetical protein [Streptomyces sp. CFMR 7]ALC26957.1 hypothetical protein ABE83_07540 [Streptomyces sp. CFMR 7]RZF06955.1 hypothetical protein C0R05_18890 [Streptomyces albidoflavus]